MSDSKVKFDIWKVTHGKVVCNVGICIGVTKSSLSVI